MLFKAARKVYLGEKESADNGASDRSLFNYQAKVLMELAETARSSPFGYEPLAAYYIAKEAEIKNIRIIKVCRESGSDKNTVMERMRRLYV